MFMPRPIASSLFAFTLMAPWHLPAFAQTTASQPSETAARPTDETSEARISRAVELWRGRPFSADNPFPLRYRSAARTLFEELMTDDARAAQAKLAFARLLAREDDAASAAEAVTLFETAGASSTPRDREAHARALITRARLTGGTVDVERIDALLDDRVRDAKPTALLLAGEARELSDADAAAGYKLQAYALMLSEPEDELSASDADRLAEAYWTGDVLPQDRDRALSLLRRAAELGSTGAASRLAARLQENGAAPSRVRDALEGAVRLGSTGAAIRLIDDFMAGGPFELSSRRALALAEDLSEIGRLKGHLYLLQLHGEGLRDLPRSPARAQAAAALVIASAKGREPGDLRALAERVQTFKLSDALRYPIAFTLFAEAARKGDAQAAERAGELVLGRPSSALYFADDEGVQSAAVEFTRQAAEAGRQSAMISLGRLYYNGRFTELDLVTAETWFARALEAQVTPRALVELSSFLLDTREDQDAVLEAIALLDRALQRGSDRARTRYGKLLYRGHAALARQRIAGLSLLRAAAANGHPAAFMELGDIMLEDQAAPETALEQYRQAIELGEMQAWVGVSRVREAQGRMDEAVEAARTGMKADDPQAIVRYVSLQARRNAEDEATRLRLLQRAEGLGIDSSSALLTTAEAYLEADTAEFRERGIAILERLVARGYKGAFDSLIADALERRNGRDADVDRAIAIARDALARRLSDPMTDVAMALYTGRGRLKPDRQRGLDLLEETYRASPDNASVAATLGVAYADGAPGIERDPKRALVYLEEAAAKGSVRALLRTARAYLYGIGTEPDLSKGLLFYERAAGAGSTKAQLDLGRIFASGSGPSLNPELAFVYFHDAAKNGSVDAQAEVGRALIAGFGVSQDIDMGLAWLERAADAGSVGAMYDLFNHHVLGRKAGDREKAIAWLRRTAEAGGTEAMFRYAIQLRNDDRPDDEIEAWLTRAADNGHKYSRRILDNGWAAYAG